MDLFQLEVFASVVEEKSFSRAAQKMFRTQPAVSQAIRKLEDEIGEALFDRSSRDGSVTEAGRVVYEHAKKLLNMRSETFKAVRELRELQRGELSIAANELTCMYLLPILTEYRQLYPTVKISVNRSLASRVPFNVLNHGTEMGLISYDPGDAHLHSIIVFRDELAFVVHPRHPLAGAGQVGIKDLGTETFVAHNVSLTSLYRLRVVEAFKQFKTPLNIAVELPTLEAIKKFVAMGNGVAFAPALCVADEIERGDLVRLRVPELKIERELRLIHRRNASLSHAAGAFLKLIEHFAATQKDRYLYRPED